MNDPDLYATIRVEPSSFTGARQALKKRHPQLFAHIESGKSDHSRIKGLVRLTMLIATTVWRREADPCTCPRCGMALHEPPTREELEALDDRD